MFGIDLSPAMLEVARGKLGEPADLRLADAAHMPYADDSFDLVTAFLTLHAMPAATRTAVMAEMVRVVHREGRLLLIDGSAEQAPSAISGSIKRSPAGRTRDDASG